MVFHQQLFQVLRYQGTQGSQGPQRVLDNTNTLMVLWATVLVCLAAVVGFSAAVLSLWAAVSVLLAAVLVS